MYHIIHHIFSLFSYQGLVMLPTDIFFFFFFLIYFQDNIKIHSCFKRNIKSTERTDLQIFKANFKCSAVIIPSVAMSINNFLLIYEELGWEKKKIFALQENSRCSQSYLGHFPVDNMEYCHSGQKACCYGDTVAASFDNLAIVKVGREKL